MFTLCLLGNNGTLPRGVVQHSFISPYIHLRLTYTLQKKKSTFPCSFICAYYLLKRVILSILHVWCVNWCFKWRNAIFFWHIDRIRILLCFNCARFKGGFLWEVSMRQLLNSLPLSWHQYFFLFSREILGILRNLSFESW